MWWLCVEEFESGARACTGGQAGRWLGGACLTQLELVVRLRVR